MIETKIKISYSVCNFTEKKTILYYIHIINITVCWYIRIFQIILIQILTVSFFP